MSDQRAGEGVMSRWRSLPVCDECWNERAPDRQAYRALAVEDEPASERCAWCEERMTNGIYVRMKVTW